MPKRAEPKPWKQYRDLDKRLQVWARWLDDQAPERIGWGVYVGDTAAGLRVQQRNDSHGDPVGREVEALTDGEIWQTHSAVTSLPELWRRMIGLLYSRPGIDYTTIAQELAIDRRVVGTHMQQAFAELDEVLTVRHRYGTNTHSGQLSP